MRVHLYTNRIHSPSNSYLNLELNKFNNLQSYKDYNSTIEFEMCVCRAYKRSERIINHHTLTDVSGSFQYLAAQYEFYGIALVMSVI